MYTKNYIMSFLYTNESGKKQGWVYDKAVRGWWKDSLFEVYDAISTAQGNSQIEGNLCEIGIWYGRSFLPFRNFLEENEQLVGVDLWIKNQKQEVLDILIECYGSLDNIIVIDGDSLKTQGQVKTYAPFRMVYIDGGHKYNEALSDLKLAEQTLTEKGVLWLDDYKNHKFGRGVSRAIKHFIDNSDFEVAFTSCLQAFLCRSSHKDFYVNIMKTLGWDESVDQTFEVTDFAHPEGFNSWRSS